MEIDRFDRQILQVLQQEGRLSNQDLADRIGLSPSPCLRRVRTLEESGIIQSYRALLNEKALGYTLTALIYIAMDAHTPERFERFEAEIRQMPEVMECYSVSGDADYFLRVVAPDLQAFSELMMKRVLRLPGVAHIKSNIALQKVKQTHVLPLDHVAQPIRAQRQIRYAGG